MVVNEPHLNVHCLPEMLSLTVSHLSMVVNELHINVYRLSVMI